MLDRVGISVDVVDDGEAAVAAVKNGSYHVVFMDMTMPRMDGLEATRSIRLWNGPQPYIIALTANAMGPDRRRCTDAGMDDFLAKPFSMKELHAKIEKAGREVDIQQSIDYAVFRTFKATLGPDADNFVVELIGDYLQEANRTRTAIHDGLSRGDSTGVREATHNLKASSAIFGAASFAQICNDVEQAAANSDFEEIQRRLPDFEKELDAVCREIRDLELQSANTAA